MHDLMSPARAAAALILLLAPAAARAQPEPVSPVPKASVRKVRVAAGPEYRASGLHRFLLGPNYRRLWTTPIDVEVLDVKRLAGGLRAEKRGGGKQTKSLRFEGEDGREFKVRSVDKDPEAALPPEYRDTFVRWVAQDQISAGLPAGPMVVDRLMEALGLLWVPHKFVVIPDDPALGKFRKEFAGMLGILEEVPRVKDPVTAGFENVEKIYNSEAVWLEGVDAGEVRVDPRAYLRARLLDMFIGDWDRHQLQFKWARVKGNPLLQPIAEDRDQAFAKFDGALLAVARMGQSRFVNFEDKYPPVFGLNWAGRFMDRRFLGELDRAAWDEEVRKVQETLPDSVLHEAVRRMPPEYDEIIGPKMVQALRARREKLPELARQYYEAMAREAEVWGTDGPDVADIQRNDDRSLEVRVAPVKEDGTAGEPFFHRIYRPGETREVRLYLQGGDDRAVSHGRADLSPIEVRVIGDGGNDVVDDSAGGGTHFYDAEGHNRMVKGPGSAYNDGFFVPSVDYVGDSFMDWGGSTGPALWVEALPDEGVLIGARLQKTAFGFRKDPYRYQQSIGAAYATTLGGWRFEYLGDFLRTNSHKRTEVLLRASDVELIRFQGFGNETSAPLGDEFYRTGQRQYLFRPRFRYGLEHLDFWVGPSLKFTHTPVRSDTFLAANPQYGVKDFGEVGIGTAMRWDARNHVTAANRGALLARRSGARIRSTRPLSSAGRTACAA
ncbi:MAG: hypothetical protein DMF78_19930 [Acidobacteria bacterium]|nr:MAG: hypothetical protein DMF78_19930 [Acidobacteriota bacterium]